MKLDTDEPTAVMALNVLLHMLSQDLLEAEECVEVCELIFIESRAISHAAGQFTVNYLFSTDFMDRARQKSVPTGMEWVGPFGRGVKIESGPHPDKGCPTYECHSL